MALPMMLRLVSSAVLSCAVLLVVLVVLVAPAEGLWTSLCAMGVSVSLLLLPLRAQPAVRVVLLLPITAAFATMAWVLMPADRVLSVAVGVAAALLIVAVVAGRARSSP